MHGVCSEGLLVVVRSGRRPRASSESRTTLLVEIGQVVHVAPVNPTTRPMRVEAKWNLT